MIDNEFPRIIQGGMGAGVSSCRLANTVSRAGQLGVVSGTALDNCVIRYLQNGDPGGHYRRALENFPFREMAERMVEKYYVEGGLSEKGDYRVAPLLRVDMPMPSQELLVMSNFAEVWLAKEGHDNPVGINYLEKIQLPHLPSIFGAMLAGVDFVLMGAGLPTYIPGILDKYVKWEDAEMKLNLVENPNGEDCYTSFSPTTFAPERLDDLKRPKFLSIISTEIVAKTMEKRASGYVDGFIVEYPTAGGHNAPPRRDKNTPENTYGPKDVPKLEKIAEIGRPFYLAGSYASPEQFEYALSMGAHGVQIGTAFAFSEESGFDPQIKQDVIESSLAGTLEVTTDFVASPTGYPFKIIKPPISDEEKERRANRPRICDNGYLRHIFRNDKGVIKYRCPSEPVDDYLKKGGKLEDTVGRQCLCNGLATNVNVGRLQKSGYMEHPVITAGDDVLNIGRFMKDGNTSYSALDVIDYMLAAQPE